MATVNLGSLGMGYREIAELAEMLTELADKGTLYGIDFDLDTLQVTFDPYKPEVIIHDGNGNTSEEDEE